MSASSSGEQCASSQKKGKDRRAHRRMFAKLKYIDIHLVIGRITSGNVNRFPVQQLLVGLKCENGGQGPRTDMLESKENMFYTCILSLTVGNFS